MPILALPVLAAADSSATFSDHEGLYEHVAKDKGLVRIFQRRTLPPATPHTPKLTVQGLAPSWGRVTVRRDRITFSRGEIRWSMPTQPFGRQSPIALDLELARLWESASSTVGVDALCLQSPVGSSGSAARWQQVIVIDRTRADKRPVLHTWSAPYASCQAISHAADHSLIAGVFEFNFESEQSASQAQFVLHDLSKRTELARYTLALPNSANLFSFTILPATR